LATVSPEKVSARPKLEVADIFQTYGTAYREKHRLTPKQHGVMRDIEQCRTGELGYHVDVCTNCGEVLSYALAGSLSQRLQTKE
jgi:hypothetical protein